MPKEKAKKENLSQRERFIKKARKIGCDETEAAFDEKLRKIAKLPEKDDPHKR